MEIIIGLLILALVLGLAWAIFKNAAKIVMVIGVIAILYCVWNFGIKDRLPDPSDAVASLSSASGDALESVKDSGKATLNKAKSKASEQGNKAMNKAKKKASDKGTEVLNKALDSAIDIANDMKK